MLSTKTIIIAIVICFLFNFCNVADNEPADYFGFKLTEFTVIEENDTHGGFLGDGSYYLILDCSQNPIRAHEIIQSWKQLPFSDNLDLIMYGGKKDGVTYGYNFAEEAHFPKISNGVYKFVDRQSESVNESDDSNLLNRPSFNFTVAMYDLNTNTLYYFEMDT